VPRFDDVPDVSPEVRRAIQRRRFLRLATAGTVVTALGAYWMLADDERTARARKEVLPDGRRRLPPGQRVLEKLKDMGGLPGNPSRADYRLRVHGAVDEPRLFDYRELLATSQLDERIDVHCVTGWSVLDARWQGVSIRQLASLVGVQPEVTHVVFEGARGYTANVPLQNALAAGAMVAHRHDKKPLAEPHGAPMRALIPDLDFWKSAKWLTGIRFETRDIPGYWEIRGYHNRGDPWLEERYG
jgi:DMSO/TMAO reductase YedYZ molybdopterin-dependent catalytic subunit